MYLTLDHPDSRHNSKSKPFNNWSAYYYHVFKLAVNFNCRYLLETLYEEENLVRENLRNTAGSIPENRQFERRLESISEGQNDRESVLCL